MRVERCARHSQKVFSSQPLIMQKRFHKLALLLISRKLIGIYIDKTLLKGAHQGRGRSPRTGSGSGERATRLMVKKKTKRPPKYISFHSHFHSSPQRKEYEN